MIKGMIWTQIKSSIENITMTEGIPIVNSCGIDAHSATVKISEGRTGVSANLHLYNLNMDDCLRDLKESLPKFNATGF
jgi:hypothetical protein